MNWVPDMDGLHFLVKMAETPVKLLFVNYPHMPTGTTADRDIFEKLVRFAIEHDILIAVSYTHLTLPTSDLV